MPSPTQTRKSPMDRASPLARSSPQQRSSPHQRSSPKIRQSPRLAQEITIAEQAPIEPVKRYISTKQKIESLKSHKEQINLTNQIPVKQTEQSTENAKPSIIDRENIVKLIEF